MLEAVESEGPHAEGHRGRWLSGWLGPCRFRRCAARRALRFGTSSSVLALYRPTHPRVGWPRAGKRASGGRRGPLPRTGIRHIPSRAGLRGSSHRQIVLGRGEDRRLRRKSSGISLGNGTDSTVCFLLFCAISQLPPVLRHLEQEVATRAVFRLTREAHAFSSILSISLTPCHRMLLSFSRNGLSCRSFPCMTAFDREPSGHLSGSRFTRLEQQRRACTWKMPNAIGSTRRSASGSRSEPQQKTKRCCLK